MFTVEWLKAGNPVLEVAMLGNEVADALAKAKTMSAPKDADTIRVTDHRTSAVFWKACYPMPNAPIHAADKRFQQEGG
jgi:hypothetical protein